WPSRSPTATETGLEPTATWRAVPRLPAPSPWSRVTLLPLAWAAATSALPSPLRSPTATAPGERVVPVLKLRAAWKVTEPPGAAAEQAAVFQSFEARPVWCGPKRPPPVLAFHPARCEGGSEVSQPTGE